MEDDHFVPPELPAETLLDRGHNETLAKLNFALALVDSIMNIADSRGSPLTILTESTTVGNVKIPAETQRKAEQLVLYLRCLHLISSALQLSKQEVMTGKLKTSSSVRNGESLFTSNLKDYCFCAVFC
jgi:serine/threonine-protein kinase ULK/ATG1